MKHEPRRAELVIERHHDVARVEAFSDGVFAFGATLLALGIRIPRPGDPDASVGLYGLVLAQWPSYVAFALSFVTVGIVWANHHIMFSYFVRTDRGLVFLNLLILMLVAFLPVPNCGARKLARQRPRPPDGCALLRRDSRSSGSCTTRCGGTGLTACTRHRPICQHECGERSRSPGWSARAIWHDHSSRRDRSEVLDRWLRIHPLALLTADAAAPGSRAPCAREGTRWP